MRTLQQAAHPVALRSRPQRGSAAPLGLLVLGVVPVVAGTLRLVQLAGGPDLMPADPRLPGIPAALVAHIVASVVFVLLGAFQFAPRLRQRGRSWHRHAGRLVGAAGLVVVLSAVWMTLLYPHEEGTGDLLFVLRLTVSTATAASLVLGFAAIRRRDIRAHRAWMMRAYALGLGAGTQVMTEGLSKALFGTGTVRDDLAKGAAWLINLAVAEWVIRRAEHSPHRDVPTAVSTARQ